MMQFKGRSLYNALKINLKENPAIQVERWQVLNYRELSIEELFHQMKELKILLNQESFLLYADTCDTPEELLECLWVDEEDLIGQDKAYLLIFELWRRLIPEKQTLSIFCDELDWLISFYDEGLLENDDILQKMLEELEDILDESIDHGATPKDIFQSVMRYMAHDLESFLYDYILDLMDESNEVYASELIDGMSPYVQERKWFEFLKIRLFALSDAPETNLLIARLLEQSEEDSDFIFLSEVCQFLVHRGDISFFLQCIRQMIPLIKVEQDLLEILRLIADFYRCLDKDHFAQVVEQSIEKRKDRDSSLSISPFDVKLIENFLSDV